MRGELEGASLSLGCSHASYKECDRGYMTKGNIVWPCKALKSTDAGTYFKKENGNSEGILTRFASATLNCTLLLAAGEYYIPRKLSHIYTQPTFIHVCPSGWPASIITDLQAETQVRSAADIMNPKLTTHLGGDDAKTTGRLRHTVVPPRHTSDLPILAH